MAKYDPVLVKIAKEFERRQAAGLQLVADDAPDDNFFEKISWLYKRMTGYDIVHGDLNTIIEILQVNGNVHDDSSSGGDE